MITANEARAVSVKDYKEFGCPFCGSPNGYARITSNGAATIWECGDCQNAYVILAEGVAQSPLFLNVNGARVRPALRPHPRRLLVTHEPAVLIKADERPAQDKSDRTE